MSRSRRRPRPLNRDKQVYRDDRLYIVACDDTYAPKQYFDAFTLRGLQIHVVPTTDGTSAAEHILERLLDFEISERDERWMLLDTDHYIKGNHRRGFLQAISRARQNGVNLAISKPCFEFWLLLHHLKHDHSDLGLVTHASSAAALLKQTLGNYNKHKLDAVHFPLSCVPKAVETARKIDSGVSGGDIPETNTTRVYKLWESIIRNASSAQIPHELSALKTFLSNQPLVP